MSDESGGESSSPKSDEGDTNQPTDLGASQTGGESSKEADLGSSGGSSLGLREGDPPAYTQDKIFYRRVSYILGGVVVLCILLGVGIYVYGLVKNNNGNPEIPDFLIAVASTSIGALAGVFAGGGR